MKLLRGWLASVLLLWYERIEDWDSYSDETLRAFDAFARSASRDLARTPLNRDSTPKA